MKWGASQSGEQLRCQCRLKTNPSLPKQDGTPRAQSPSLTLELVRGGDKAGTESAYFFHHCLLVIVSPSEVGVD